MGSRNRGRGLGPRRAPVEAARRGPREFRPADALVVYLRLVDNALTTADRRAYQAAIRYLESAKRAAIAAEATNEFQTRVTELRELHRRRPSLITLLDKAGFG